MSKKTPLYQFHLDNQGRMVEFGGFLLPVNYSSGIIHEHNKVRTEVGLFDVSHMAEIHLKGKELVPFLNHLLTNEFSNMKSGKIKYTLMLNERGTVIDDLLVYYFDNNHAMLVCNAANHEKALNWITQQAPESVEVDDQSAETGLLSLQGPHAQKVMEMFCDENDLPSKYYTFKDEVSFDSHKVLISRTGYTGEDGFEIYCQWNDTLDFANKLLSTNLVTLCGLGSRDTLRLEAGLPLYGHELSEEINPFEANLNPFIKMNKDDFIGKSALENADITQTRVGLKLIDRGIAREESDVYVDDKKIGVVTSGTKLPFVGYAGAMALINKEFSTLNQIVDVDVRGRKLKAEVIKLPFYSRKKEEK